MRGVDRPKVAHRLRRGAYLLPSLFTIGNILLGFYAVVRSVRGDFQMAALLVFAAAILDALDGRIARLTGTESEFGREYDSLADVVTFGVTPALMAYFWGLRQFGRVGWLVPFFFLVCTATRLARFNVQTKVADSRFFVGLPAPAAAGAVCSLFFFAPTGGGTLWMAAVAVGAMLAIGVLMVTTFRYRSFKKIDLRKPRSYRMVLPLAAIVLLAAYQTELFFLATAAIYTLSGPLGWLFGRFKRPGGSAGEMNAVGPGGAGDLELRAPEPPGPHGLA